MIQPKKWLNQTKKWLLPFERAQKGACPYHGYIGSPEFQEALKIATTPRKRAPDQQVKSIVVCVWARYPWPFCLLVLTLDLYIGVFSYTEWILLDPPLHHPKAEWLVLHVPRPSTMEVDVDVDSPVAQHENIKPGFNTPPAKEPPQFSIGSGGPDKKKVGALERQVSTATVDESMRTPLHPTKPNRRRSWSCQISIKRLSVKSGTMDTLPTRAMQLWLSL